jgi:hypothetical protein
MKSQGGEHSMGDEFLGRNLVRTVRIFHVEEPAALAESGIACLSMYVTTMTKWRG